LSEKRIIYDFGSNNGDDIPYYLMKSEHVVAVEANPLLCAQIRARFCEAIDSGNLVVENCVLSVEQSTGEVPFYIHKTNHVLSQFPVPTLATLDQFEEVTLPSKNPIELITTYGDPYYVKIDVEHYDQAILRSLFEANIRPPYISAEAHSIEVFALLVAHGRYPSFKLVDGDSVSIEYQDHEINAINGPKRYSFPIHSAGPFGSDIKGPWISADNLFRLLRNVNLGWKDIHASLIDLPDEEYAVFSPQIETIEAVKKQNYLVKIAKLFGKFLFANRSSLKCIL